MARRVAVVTAASRGIGAACARELAAGGYVTVVMSRSSEVLRLATEVGGFGMQGATENVHDLERLVAETESRFGQIDAVINNTGHPAVGELLELSDSDWHAGLDLVFLNVVRLARLVTPLMVRRGGGAIVNISSFAAVEPSGHFPISSALRAALSGFVKLYADRYGSAGIRMNNVLPGYIDTLGTTMHNVEPEERSGGALGRLGTVEEVAKVVAFLVSPSAAYVTGESVRVDGGLTRSL